MDAVLDRDRANVTATSLTGLWCQPHVFLTPSQVQFQEHCSTAQRATVSRFPIPGRHHSLKAYSLFPGRSCHSFVILSSLPLDLANGMPNKPQSKTPESTHRSYSSYCIKPNLSFPLLKSFFPLSITSWRSAVGSSSSSPAALRALSSLNLVRAACRISCLSR